MMDNKTCATSLFAWLLQARDAASAALPGQGPVQ